MHDEILSCPGNGYHFVIKIHSMDSYALKEVRMGPIVSLDIKLRRIEFSVICKSCKTLIVSTLPTSKNPIVQAKLTGATTQIPRDEIKPFNINKPYQVPEKTPTFKSNKIYLSADKIENIQKERFKNIYFKPKKTTSASTSSDSGIENLRKHNSNSITSTGKISKPTLAFKNILNLLETSYQSELNKRVA